MPPIQHPLTRRWSDALIVIAFAMLVLFLQVRAGAYRADFSGDADEPSHVVSSLMVRQYLLDGLPGNPIAYAEDYYLHYPKVAIGHWPPLFYAVEAAAMTVFGNRREVLIGTLAVIMTALLASVFFYVRVRMGVIPALFAALLQLAPYYMLESAYTVSPNVLLVLLTFWSMLAYGEWLRSRSRSALVLYILLALCATATHFRGVAVFLIPLTAAFLMKPLSISITRVLVVVAVIAILIAAPISGQTTPLQASAVFRNAFGYGYRAVATLSVPVIALAFIGITGVKRWREDPTRLVITATIAAHWFFLTLVDVLWGDYYLASILPATSIGAAFGLVRLRELVPFLRHPAAFAAGCLLAGSIVFVNILLPVLKTDTGLQRWLAEGAVRLEPGALSLVAGGAEFEGALIAEQALRAPKPDHYILRSTKVLARADWAMKYYSPKFKETAALREFLDGARVGPVIFEWQRSRPDLELLRTVVQGNGSAWREVAEPAAPATVRVYRREAPFAAPRIPIRVYVRQFLRKTLEVNILPSDTQ